MAYLTQLPDLPGPLKVDVARSVSRLSQGYRWRTPSDRASFESCATESVRVCLDATPPASAVLDPDIRSILIGVGVGAALVKGGRVIAFAAVALWLVRGQTIRTAIGL